MGIVTGKLPEYMMMGKPIISIVSGELPWSTVKSMTDQCRLGFCFEEAVEADYEALKDYIAMQYRHFCATGKVLYCPDVQEVDKYRYRSLTSELQGLFPTG